MRIIGEVIWYNPTEAEKGNIKTYLNFVDKLYIIDKSEIENTIPVNNKKIEYVFNNENIGISKAMNRAAKKALEAGYEWMLTMDQDTKMNEYTFKEFNELIKKVDTSIIGIITPWHKTKLCTIKPCTKYDYPLDVMTSGNFVNLKILKQIGFYEERFFIDGIDIEYGLRLAKNGYSIIRMNNAEIEHNLGDITYHKLFGQQIICTNHNYKRQYYMTRNYRYIKEQYEDIFPSYCTNLIKNKKNILTILLYEKDKIKKIKYIKKGIKDYKNKIYGKLGEN